MCDKAKTRRNRIVELINALRAKTTTNGCTEEEAMAAAAKIAELMDRYDLEESDVELGAAECELRAAGSVKDQASQCANAIAEFTDTKVFDASGELKFFGLPPDVEVAGYLLDICRGAINRGTISFMAELGLFRRDVKLRKVESFQLGMARSMNAKLVRMKGERRRNAIRDTGRDLVPVKAAIIARDIEKLGVRIKGGRCRSRKVDDGAFSMGVSAGASVRFDPGVGGVRPHAAIAAS